MHEMQHGGMNKMQEKIQRGYGLLLGCYMLDLMIYFNSINSSETSVTVTSFI